MKPKTKRQSSLPDAATPLPAMGEYAPQHFLCCHSIVDGEKRKKTKVWMSAFEPSLHTPGETGTVLATCGGNTVCFIDCLTGLVMKRFKDTDKAEDFYAVAWTSLEGDCKKMNILAVAGLSCSIKLIYPDQLMCYSTIRGHSKYVSCLAFHPQSPSLLFSGSKDGSIMLWNIGRPGAEGTVNHSPMMKLKTSSSVGDALCMTFSVKKNSLVAVTEKGFVGWSLGNVAVPSTNQRTQLIDYLFSSREHNFSFVFPKTGSSKHQVDSLVAMDNGLIATKCMGSEDILVWNLDEHLSSRGHKKRVEVQPLLHLVYPEAEVKYINMGYGNGVLSVGDDKGQIHLYRLRDVLSCKAPSFSRLLPSQVLEWPEVDGLSEEETRNNVVLNNVVVSSDHSFVAGGTDNNLVCIWRRTQN